MLRRLSLATLTLLLTGPLPGCNKNVEEGAEMVISGQNSARTESSAQGASANASAANASAAPAAGGGVLEGTIQLAPAIASQVRGTEVLFIIARPPGGGPPLAVKKISQPRFPQQFRLGAEDVMMEGFELSGQVSLTARLDQDGMAGPLAPGDFVGSAGTLTVGAPSISLVIDQDASGAAPRVQLPDAPPGDTMAARPMVLQGTIQLDPALAAQAQGAAALYVIARTGEGGPPLAVKRLAVPTFPFQFQLTSADMMLQGRDFSGAVQVSARLDRDGAAGPAASGDLIGATSGTVEVGGAPFEIQIREVVP